jgi:hypothetical protein
VSAKWPQKHVWDRCLLFFVCWPYRQPSTCQCGTRGRCQRPSFSLSAAVALNPTAPAAKKHAQAIQHVKEFPLPSPPSFLFLHLSAAFHFNLFQFKRPSSSFGSGGGTSRSNDSIQCQRSAVIIRLRAPLLTFYSRSFHFFRRTICNFFFKKWKEPQSVDGYLPPQV